MAFTTIADNKRYLTRPNGPPFFMLGTNYEGYFDRAWQMWDDGKFDPGLITRDFRKMADAGLNVVRLFVLPALDKALRHDDFSKLDRVLQIAADYNLLVLLTFNDSHFLSLAYAARLDAKIAARYQDDPVILGWDLENEPRFYNFAAAVYPESHPAPIQSNVLVNHYGPRVTQAEAIELQKQRRIPGHLNPQQAFYYINALKYFIDFAADAGRWGAPTGKTVVDYMYSNDSARWHKLIEVLNGTVAAWLAVRQTPVRQADPNHLITIGYNWLYFAGLPANRALDFQQYHKYGSASRKQLQQTFRDLAGLQQVFPNHPLMLGEFGYSNQTSTNPATSKPVPEDLTALFETALLAHLRANNYAGGLKWMLNDVDTTANPYEANFGIYRLGDHPKPVRDLLARLRQEWPAPPAAGTLKIIQDPAGLAMRLNLGETIMLGGGVFQDESFSWQPDGVAYCFLSHQENKLTVQVHGRGCLAVDPWEIAPGWLRDRRSILYQVINDTPVEQATFPPEERVSWELLPDITYQLEMGQTPEPPPTEEEPEIVPNAGEHVILLPDSDPTLNLALPYIRKFGPDMTFAPNRVAGRWSYVTVVATAEQISDDILQTIRASGAQIVERITGDVSAVLNDLINRNRRFLSSDPLTPPEEPPGEPPEPPEDVEFYTVQPGDTLSKIALRFYGKSSLWTIIFEANRDVLDSPSLIRPGMQLKIPLN